MHHFAEGTLHMYMDLHAHAAKRGCFIYGNHLPSLREQVLLCATHAHCFLPPPEAFC